jgi:hypothetical protein
VSCPRVSSRQGRRNKPLMQPFDAYRLVELKLVYRLLHSQLPEHPALMDSQLLHDLQGYLQQRARKDGVDVSLHAEWAAWLNNLAE